MSQRTIYKCDRCGKESENQNNLFEIAIGIKHKSGGVYYLTNQLYKQQDWCKKCCEETGIIFVDKEKEKEKSIDTKPTLEDLIKEIAVDAAITVINER